MSQAKEQIIIFRRVWKSGNRYWLSIPKQIAEHYKLEGKFLKAVLEVIET